MRHHILTASTVAILTCLFAAGTSQAQEVAPATTITWKGAPQFQWGEFTFKPRGRVYFDYVAQDVNPALGPDTSAAESRLRTARLGVQGTWTDQWSYVAEASIGNGSANWDDLALTWSPSEYTAVKVGNYKSLSLENLTSSRYTTFMERGPFNDLIDAGRVMTLSARTGGANWSLTGGVHGDSINDPSVGGKEQAGAFVRAHFAPVVTDDVKIHLGAWGRVRDRRDDSAFRYRVRNNTNFGNRYTDAGSSALGAGDKDSTYGLEAAGVWRNVSVQGEWAGVNADLTGGGQANARAYYVMASFFPTGEQRKYDAADGEFGRVKIRRPVTEGGPGAVELGVRYDNADLTDFAGVATAGRYSAVTVGATWYPFPYVRFLANYSDARNDAQVATADVNVQTLQFRGQFDF
ncbi:porin [uncultured Brevundimonas sp.]|mgnify:CR=1 FL=1|uniref:OprO/OprP family phosphate-selective porin n=1 Tax=uncultured Brevundimonas sp. TaxID=213418 RepID=UPI0030EDA4A6|tara:strand:+ start:27517 stop:28734 length:1218 start_codon:yes stop_codon:yes gene_type:complete